MELRVLSTEFTKENDKYHVQACVETNDGTVSIEVELPISNLPSQTYYASKAQQITDTLKVAFHMAGLFTEKLELPFQSDFNIPSHGDSPELWVNGHAYYQNEKLSSGSFEECFTSCVNAINEHQSGNGEQLKYASAGSYAL